MVFREIVTVYSQKQKNTQTCIVDTKHSFSVLKKVVNILTSVTRSHNIVSQGRGISELWIGRDVEGHSCIMLRRCRARGRGSDKNQATPRHVGRSYGQFRAQGQGLQR